jgi:transcription antitermination factor NusG
VQETECENFWRAAEDRAPDPGVFVELSRDEDKVIDQVYWIPGSLRLDGLFWRFGTPPNFLRVEPSTDRPPIDEDYWYVVLVEPNQELMTVWRLHEQGKELYIPSIRRRVKTGRTGKNGTKVTRVIPKPMFPGYGLIRCTGIKDKDINKLLKVRGVRQVLRDQGKPIVLPHEAVLAIFRKESQERHEFVALHAKGKKRAPFKAGDTVRIEAAGNVYDGLLATIEKDDGKDRIKVFLGMAKMKHEIDAGLVVAA